MVDPPAQPAVWRAGIEVQGNARPLFFICAGFWLLAGALLTTLVFSHLVLHHWHYYLMFALATAMLCAIAVKYARDAGLPRIDHLNGILKRGFARHHQFVGCREIVRDRAARCRRERQG